MGSRSNGSVCKVKSFNPSAPMLRYYNRNFQLCCKLMRQHGLGATLLQQDQPVTWASCALTKTEQNYAQIEKECLAISFGFSRFHRYLFDKKDITVSNYFTGFHLQWIIILSSIMLIQYPNIHVCYTFRKHQSNRMKLYSCLYKK